ncbi:MAG TPA: cytochrome c-type biogenesis protein CcmH [Actinomycetota bacterium]|nr:cytochrome c-type biogenesis protein CcmH [Actinomycetota bacterium]
MKKLITVGALILVLAPPATAAPADVANSVASKIMSPYCPGVTLHDCPSNNATELMTRIEGMARDGFSEAQIIDLLVAEFGPGIRAAPLPSGAGLAAWLVPIVGAAAGGGLAWLLLHRWVRRAAVGEGYDPDIHVTPADRARLERELELFQGEA